MMKPALIIGTTCVDVNINIPHLPATQEDIHPTAQTMTLGGCAHNVAYIVRLLETEHTFISPVGTGMYGDYVEKLLKEEGTEVTIHVPDRENGCCYCLVEENGERTFMSYHGVEYSFQKEWMEPYRAEDFGLVYICGLEVEEPTGWNIVEYLEEHRSLQIFFAPGPRLRYIEKEKMERILALKPMLHLNELEAMELSGATNTEEAAEILYGRTQNAVIITRGEKGVYCKEVDGTAYLVPSVPAEHIVDTIGAGDSHAGTIIACLTKDWSLFDALSYANKVSAAVVQINGIGLKKEQLPRF